MTPLYASWIAKAETGGMISEEGYAEELNAIAKRNQEGQRAKVEDYYYEGKEASYLLARDQILLKREQRKSALEPKFDGPFRVIQRRGSIVEAKRGRMRQWIHINRCKKCECSMRLSIPPFVEGTSGSTEIRRRGHSKWKRDGRTSNYYSPEFSTAIQHTLILITAAETHSKQKNYLVGSIIRPFFILDPGF